MSASDKSATGQAHTDILSVIQPFWDAPTQRDKASGSRVGICYDAKGPAFPGLVASRGLSRT